MSGAGDCKSRALLFGHEGTLLTSRKWLLATVGCDCLTATSMAEYREKVLTQTLNLIVLCQTSSNDECTSASEFAAEHLPNAPLLVMFSPEVKCTPDRDYVLLDSMAGPGAFVQTIERMLATAASRINRPN